MCEGERNEQRLSSSSCPSLESSAAPSSSMPSTPKKSVRVRKCKFNEEWLQNESFKDWLKKDKDPNHAYCIACNRRINVQWDGVKALNVHSRTKFHTQKIRSRRISTTVESFFSKNTSEEDEVTVVELTKTFHCVKHHYSYLSMDCGNKLDQVLFRDSKIVPKIRLGRTKMEAIAVNVLCPYSIEMALKDLRDETDQPRPFSVSTDASNKGTKKMFPLAIRVFNEYKGVRNYLLDFYEEPDETSESIANKILEALKKLNLSIDSCVAYGADNASVNYGKYNSVFQKLKTKTKRLLKANCNCHVVHNAAKHAFKLISFDIESLVLKVFNEFSISAKNVEALKHCFEFVEQEYHQVLRHIPVRWLSLFNAVERLLLNWEPIKSYFIEQGRENCDKIIWKFIGDQENELSKKPTLPEVYINFFHSTLSLFQKAILKLEDNNICATELYDVMDNLKQQLQNRIDDSFFGFVVNQSLRFLPSNQQNKFREEATSVYSRAIDYLNKWFDYENSPFKYFKTLSLDVKIPTLDNFLKLQEILSISLDGDKLYDEYCCLKAASPALLVEKMTPPEKWIKFFKNTPNAANLKKIVQTVLAVPCSNAFVERIFSVMNHVWTDPRNRLGVDMVKAELCICENLNLACHEFHQAIKDNKELISAAKSSKKYKFK